ncbi:MAG: GTPase HflX [Anaerolineae bacterium]|jgi:GTP-binding protein HflX|nr:GTPase HflX [Anaerolineae bacterium]
MTEFYEPNQQEKAYLVGVTVKGSRPLLSVQESLKELALLADTAGMIVTGQASQTVGHIDPSTFIGSGKVEEVKEEMINLETNILIFDDELSPRHQRELERRFGESVKIIDRSTLILDIFAQHARTREGALQVELAQYEYRLPRLTRQWTHLARQAGGSGSKAGVGLRGPGETQLEVDKREIGRKISKLKEEIELVRMHRGQHRKQRTKSGVPVIALVGYTNAGKSTLLKAITGADVYIADQLFATLDPTTRRFILPSNRQVLLSDTVGFIQKLPTTLITAFRATLEEIAEADLILHVVDVSHPNVLQHIESVEDTLAELDVTHIPKLLVWNKVDRLKADIYPPETDMSEYVEQIRVSAVKSTGINDLLEAIEQALVKNMRPIRLLIPYERGELISQLFNIANVENQEHTNDGVIITVQMPVAIQHQYEQFQLKG